MTINEKEIFERLNRLHGDLVEKLGAQPYLGAPMIVFGNDNCSLQIYGARKEIGGGDILHNARSETIAETLNDAEEFVANMPDPNVRAKREWQGKLAKVIDEGHDLNLPGEVMTPLRQGAQAMTENLLAGPVE